ncbi:MAG: hypothetical protein ISS84_00380 [Candidatus Pacebacteria bacterium]|nr:hypothetical protein [Candidatus Paceibacterota bacterium]
MNFLSKLIFYFKKPQIIIVAGRGRSCAAEAIFQVLRPHFKVGRLTNSPCSVSSGQILGKEILIFESKIEKAENFNFLIKKSSLPILVVTYIGDIPPDKDFFTGEREKTTEIRKLARILPSQGYLILNFDDETVREIGDELRLSSRFANARVKDETNLQELTFGFQEGADFRATDINLNSGTNFKINHKGNIVPIWLEKLFGKEQIYASLSAVSIGVIFDLNLVEISQLLKNYQGIVGKRNGSQRG